MKICIFGDSIVWGARDTQKGGWAERLKTYFMKTDPEIMVYNVGVSSDTTSDLLKRLNAEARARKADAIIIAIGINDSRYIDTKGNYPVDLETFQSNLKEILEIAQNITDKVLFIGLTPIDESKTMPIPWRPSMFYDEESVSKYSKALEAFCSSNNVQYVSMNGVVDKNELPDGLHPDSNGHEKMYQVVKSKVNEYLHG